jgi:hypothetical protein
MREENKIGVGIKSDFTQKSAGAECWNPAVVDYPYLGPATVRENKTVEAMLVEGSEEKSPAPLWNINLKAENIDSYMVKVQYIALEEGPWQVVINGRARSIPPQA